jgi:hypothetical protein
MHKPQNKNLEQNLSIDWKTGLTSIRFDKQPGEPIDFDSKSLSAGAKRVPISIRHFETDDDGVPFERMEPHDGTPFEIVRQASFSIRIPRKPESACVKAEPKAEPKAELKPKARPASSSSKDIGEPKAEVKPKARPVSSNEKSL